MNWTIMIAITICHSNDIRYLAHARMKETLNADSRLMKPAEHSGRA